VLRSPHDFWKREYSGKDSAENRSGLFCFRLRRCHCYNPAFRAIFWYDFSRLPLLRLLLECCKSGVKKYSVTRLFRGHLIADPRN